MPDRVRLRHRRASRRGAGRCGPRIPQAVVGHPGTRRPVGEGAEGSGRAGAAVRRPDLASRTVCRARSPSWCGRPPSGAADAGRGTDAHHPPDLVALCDAATAAPDEPPGLAAGGVPALLLRDRGRGRSADRAGDDGDRAGRMVAGSRRRRLLGGTLGRAIPTRRRPRRSPDRRRGGGHGPEHAPSTSPASASPCGTPRRRPRPTRA